MHGNNFMRTRGYTHVSAQRTGQNFIQSAFYF